MTSTIDSIQEAAAFVRKAAALTPKVGVVLGSGLGAFAERVGARLVLPYRTIPHFPVSGVAGHAGELVLGTLDGVPCAVMSGRVHYYEGYDMQQVTFPMRVLAALGIRTVLVTNAAGSVNASYEPGSFMVINDHLNLTGANPLRGPNDDRLGPRFPDMSEVYDRRLLDLCVKAASEIGVGIKTGVYLGVTGPSYETPAEIRAFRMWGADLVGMSTVSEAIVARHMGQRVLAISLVTNQAAGRTPMLLTHEEVVRVGDSKAEQAARLVRQILLRL